MGQSKEVKQHWKEPKNFDISLCMIFSCYDESLILRRETGHLPLPRTNFEIFLIFDSFLRF